MARNVFENIKNSRVNDDLLPFTQMLKPFSFRFIRTVAVVLALAPWLFAQRYHISYAPNSQEGLFLQLIEQLEGPAKVAQLEAFVQKYPTHASAAWALSFLQENYAESNEIDKALAAGEKLLALHPEDLEAATLNQKLADKKNDPAVLKKWTEAVERAAKELASALRQTNATGDNFKARQEYAAGVVAGKEYDEYRVAVSAATPEARARLLEAFLKIYPATKYMDGVQQTLMSSYRQIGASQKALDLAEKLLVAHPNLEDALVVVAETWLDRRQNYPRVLAICHKLLAMFEKRPQGVEQAEFEKRRAHYSGIAYQILGYAHVFQNNFEEADRFLRLALSFVRANSQPQAGLLFYIGYANYYQEKYAVAADFFRQCLAIPGPMQEMARRQINVLKQERRIP